MFVSVCLLVILLATLEENRWAIESQCSHRWAVSHSRQTGELLSHSVVTGELW